MKLRSLMFALAGTMLMAGSALAADVTFALQAPAGGRVVFSKAPLKGLPKPGTPISEMRTIDGVDYYVWRTSISKTAIVCGVYATDPNASSKCVGTAGTQLQLNGNFVVLR